MSTADSVISALTSYGIVDKGSGKYVSNSPLRANSDSGAFSLTISGPEHGCFNDHVSGETGSLYDLAKVLGIDTRPASLPTPKVSAPATPKVAKVAKASKRPKELIATYDYVSADGTLLYQSLRYRYTDEKGGKDFRQRRPDGNDGWEWNMRGVTYVLYRLPEVIAAVGSNKTVYVVEGEKDADNLRDRGYTATTNVAGSGKWKPEYTESLRGADIVVLPDNDDAGMKHGREVCQSLVGVAARVRMVILPELPDKGDFTDWVDAGHSRKEFNAVVATTLDYEVPVAIVEESGSGPNSAAATADDVDAEQRAWESEHGGDTDSADLRKAIDVTEADLMRLRAEVWEAVLASDVGARLYLHNGVVSEFADRAVVPINGKDKHDVWSGILSNVARFVKREGKRFNIVEPPVSLVRQSLLGRFVSPNLPRLDYIEAIPVFNASGDLLIDGYYADSKTLVISGLNTQVMHVEKAKSLILDDLLGDFPLKGDADRANAVAMLLTPFVRAMFDISPLFLIEAATAGTGKGLLSKLAQQIWTGTVAAPTPFHERESERVNTIATHLLENPVCIAFDEVTWLGGPMLQMMLTATEAKQRLLHTNTNARLTNRTTWIATGNNVQLAQDMPRRTVTVRMQSEYERPEDRSDFKHTDIYAWAVSNRERLVSACVSLVQHGLAHGRPNAVMGSFEKWASTMSTILNGVGIVGFLSNKADTRDHVEDTHDGWESVVRAWFTTHSTQILTPTQVAELILNDNDNGITLNGDDRKAQIASARLMVKGKVGKVFTVDGSKVMIKLTKAKNGNPAYCLDPVPQGKVTVPVAPPAVTNAPAALLYDEARHLARTCDAPATNSTLRLIMQQLDELDRAAIEAIITHRTAVATTQTPAAPTTTTLKVTAQNTSIHGPIRTNGNKPTWRVLRNGESVGDYFVESDAIAAKAAIDAGQASFAD